MTPPRLSSDSRCYILALYTPTPITKDIHTCIFNWGIRLRFIKVRGTATKLSNYLLYRVKILPQLSLCASGLHVCTWLLYTLNFFRLLRLMVLILQLSTSNTVCPSLNSKSRGGLDGTLDWCIFVRHSLVCSNLLSVCYIYSHKYAFHWNLSTTSTELNEVDGTLSGGVCRCYHAHLVDDKIIQHELLMSWIIACFHGYGLAECVACSQSGDGKDGSGKIKTTENLKTLRDGLSGRCHRRAVSPDWRHE